MPLTQNTPAGVFSQPLDNQQIAGYVLLQDMNGQPALLLRASASRLAWQQVQLSIRYLLVFLLLIGAVFSALTLLLIDRLFYAKRAAETGFTFIWYHAPPPKP